MRTIFLGFGSNMGDRAENIRRAIRMLAPEIIVDLVSPVYETKAMYNLELEDFLNAAARAHTDREPIEMLRKVKAVELALGRTKDQPHNTARPIDIDILCCDDLTTESDELTIPHARMGERAFVLVPLNDIAAEHVHPHFKKTVGELLAALGDTSRDVRPTTVRL